MTRTATALLAALLLAACGGGGGEEPPDATSLVDAHDTCTVGELGDEGRTLFLDMKGEEVNQDYVPELSLEDVVCVLVELDTPESVTRLMDQTRALDGRQSADWAGFTASWSYHPDSGLDILLTEG